MSKTTTQIMVWAAVPFTLLWVIMRSIYYELADIPNKYIKRYWVCVKFVIVVSNTFVRIDDSEYEEWCAKNCKSKYKIFSTPMPPFDIVEWEFHKNICFKYPSDAMRFKLAHTLDYTNE